MPYFISKSRNFEVKIAYFLLFTTEKIFLFQISVWFLVLSFTKQFQITE